MIDKSDPSGVAAAPEMPVWRPSAGLAVLLIAASFLLIVPFAAELHAMWRWWLDRPEYSHGVLMPALALLLAWQQRDRLERLPLLGSWWGLGLVLLGGLLLLLGKLAAVQVIVQYAFVVTLAGLVLALVGRRVAGMLLVPLVILVLMIPPPEFIFKSMTAGLQLVSSQLGVAIVRLCGVSAYLEGNVIDLGSYKLEVAEACSGLRYLFPLMVLSYIMAYFFKTAFWRRALVFASSVPVTIVMNSLRIGAIGVMVDHWGPAMAEGFLHDFEGWFMFMVSAAFLLLEIAVLSRIGRYRQPWRQVFAVDFPAATSPSAPRAQWQAQWPFLASLAVLCVLAGVVALMPPRTEIVPSRESFVQFPLNLGQWQGHRVPMEPVYVDALKLDDYIIADYRRAAALPVNLYVAWYNSQRAGQSTHSPRTCLPGGGWQIVSLQPYWVPNARIAGSAVRVNRAVIEYGTDRQLVYYWFQQRGRVITNEYLVKWYMFVDSLLRRRTDGSLIRLIVPVPSGVAIDQAQSELDAFTRAVTQRLPPYIPG